MIDYNNFINENKDYGFIRGQMYLHTPSNIPVCYIGNDQSGKFELVFYLMEKDNYRFINWITTIELEDITPTIQIKDYIIENNYNSSVLEYMKKSFYKSKKGLEMIEEMRQELINDPDIIKALKTNDFNL